MPVIPEEKIFFDNSGANLQKRLKSTLLSDGDVVALDDTHAPHQYAEKIPFLYWLFDSLRKVNVWAMNLVVIHAIRKNNVEYPWFYAIWKKPQTESGESQKNSKIVVIQHRHKTPNMSVMDIWAALCRIHCTKQPF